MFLYHFMRNFCNLIGLEQWYFSLFWNVYKWKLETKGTQQRFPPKYIENTF